MEAVLLIEFHAVLAADFAPSSALLTLDLIEFHAEVTFVFIAEPTVEAVV